MLTRPLPAFLSLSVYAITMLIGTILGCVAGLPGVNGYALFVAGRVIIGFGMASFLMTSLIVVQEITHPRTRATMAASWVHSSPHILRDEGCSSC
jgi:MFS family permease